MYKVALERKATLEKEIEEGEIHLRELAARRCV